MDELEEIRRKRLEEMQRKTSYPSSPITVTNASLDDIVQRYPLVVIDCWAPWCGPCLMIADVIEELARDYQGRIVFGKLNIDENRETALKYGIMSIPLLLAFKNGVLVDNILGAMPRAALEPKLKQVLELN